MRGWKGIWIGMGWKWNGRSQGFAEEFRALKDLEDLPRKKKLNYLSPFFDDNTGLIKVGGRMHNPCLPEEKKIQLFYLVNNSMSTCWFKTSTKGSSRRKRPISYSIKTIIWLVQGGSAVKKVIKRCRICRHSKANAFTQEMAPLPKEWITPFLSFTHIGNNFLGPLYATVE